MRLRRERRDGIFGLSGSGWLRGGVLVGLLLVASAASAAPIGPRDALMTQLDRVLAVDLVTGDQRVVADGGLLSSPTGVAGDTAGNVFVLDADRVIHIAPDGTQAVLASGGLLMGARDLTLGQDGNVIATSGLDCCTVFASKGLVEIDRVSGAQTQLVADFPVNGPGGLGLRSPLEVEVTEAGDVLVLDRSLQGSFGGVASIDPDSGAGDFELILSGGPFVFPSDLAIAPDGTIVVNYIDNDTGKRELVLYDPDGNVLGVLPTAQSYEEIVYDTTGDLIGFAGDTLYDISGGESIIASHGLLGDGLVRDLSEVGPAVPEPSAALLLALGTLIVGSHLRRPH